jgi:hypothetical protein
MRESNVVLLKYLVNIGDDNFHRRSNFTQGRKWVAGSDAAAPGVKMNILNKKKLFRTQQILNY